MYKKSVMLVLMFLLVVSLVSAENETTSNCDGVWGSIKCLLFCDSSKRPVAGAAWYENE